MEKMLERLLIVNDQQGFARHVAAVAERLGLATRILPHTLDFEYLMHHWRPNFVAVQMAMADQQDVEVLEALEKMRYPGHVILTGDVSARSLNEAARVAQQHGLRVASVLMQSSSGDAIDAVLRLTRGLERAA